jgi:hypothetical protein
VGNQLEGGLAVAVFEVLPPQPVTMDAEQQRPSGVRNECYFLDDITGGRPATVSG